MSASELPPSLSSDVADDIAEYAEAENRLKTVVDDEEKRALLISMGKLAYIISNECLVEERMRWLDAAYNRLKTAFDMDETEPECLRLLAAATGRLAEDSGIRQKISLGFEFKKYLDMAIAADRLENAGNTFELFHMRGRFAYTVLSMSLAERVLARMFGVVPVFTVDGAVSDLKRAAELVPAMAENELFLAKCLLLKGNREEAKDRLRTAVNCAIGSTIEQEYKNESQELLRGLGE